MTETNNGAQADATAKDSQPDELVTLRVSLGTYLKTKAEHHDATELLQELTEEIDAATESIDIRDTAAIKKIMVMQTQVGLLPRKLQRLDTRMGKEHDVLKEADKACRLMLARKARHLYLGYVEDAAKALLPFSAGMPEARKVVGDALLNVLPTDEGGLGRAVAVRNLVHGITTQGDIARDMGNEESFLNGIARLLETANSLLKEAEEVEERLGGPLPTGEDQG